MTATAEKTAARRDDATFAEIEDFIHREARLLDKSRYDDWLALFASDAYYWVPLHPEQKSPEDEVSIFYDDRMLMETRVRRLAHAHAHAQTPQSRTLRVLGRVALEAHDPAKGEYVTEATFMMIEYRQNEQRVYGGTVRHGVRRAGKGWCIAWKRVDLVNADGVHEPISVPF
jgi:benzoate/toluate 1,2-dioxygenase beta subunit